jgi:hypothetical protein
MREFILIDLQTQMPYLPQTMRDWQRKRILAWMRVWGEVRWYGELPWHGPLTDSKRDLYGFYSWCGLTTGFILTEDRRMFIPGTGIKEWSGT